MKRKIIFVLTFCVIIVFGSSYTLSNRESNNSCSNSPAGTIIILTNNGALTGTGWWEWRESPNHDWHWHLYPYREIKVMFTGNRTSDGQSVTDPNCPYYETTYSYPTCSILLANFYYLGGTVSVYSRDDSSQEWTYDGNMLMNSSSFATMDGNNIVTYTIHCGYLSGGAQDDVEGEEGG